VKRTAAHPLLAVAPWADRFPVGLARVKAKKLILVGDREAELQLRQDGVSSGKAKSLSRAELEG
jgi:hypothetical protein